MQKDLLQKAMLRLLAFMIIFVQLSVQATANEPVTENNPTDLPVFSENYQYYITTLASDEFEGRDPLTPGGRKTKDFIESEFRRIGLKPAYNGTFRQPVPVFRSQMSNISDLVITGNDQKVSFTMPDDMIISTQAREGNIDVVNSEIVFAGYGIVAPEYDWDDYTTTDINGKTVLVFINDPGQETNDPGFFQGTTMTTYGRMDHKYEQALSRGAKAVYIIHDEKLFPTPWERFRNTSGRSRLQLETGNTQEGPLVQGWINQHTASAIFEQAGYSYHDLKKKALKSEFQAFPLDLTASVSFDMERISGSYNIAGYIPGSKYPDETVIYLAHWDHLGTRETAEGTVIFNGAIDNATGTAAIMAIAERFATMDPPPARNVLFLAVTAEESGLLGARHYVSNPIFPLETTAGVINIDMMNITGPTRDLFAIGYGLTDMQEIMRKHLADRNRVLLPDPQPEQRFFQRSDHYVFARAGVPVVFTYGGTDFTGPNVEELQRLYTIDDRRYHTPDDIVHDHWSWEAIDNNLWIFYHLGKDLANSREWPQWITETPYREERLKSEEKRR